MKIYPFVCVVLLTCFQNTQAQSFDWARIAGDTTEDMGKSIVVDAAGNSYTTGYFQGTVDFDPGTSPGDTFKLTSFGGKDIFLTKMNAQGDLLWAKQMGGLWEDIGTAVAISKSGHVYAMGSFDDTVDLNPEAGIAKFISAGLRDISICKFDTSGKFLWAKSIGGIGDDQVRTLAIDNNENLIFAGVFYATLDFNPASSGTYNLSSNGWGDVFCCKLDSSGAFKWANATGGVDSDECYGVAVDSSGNVYTTGRFQRTCDFDPGAGSFVMSPVGLLDGYITKYNASGSFAWSKQFGGANSDITGFSIVTTKNNIVYLAGAYKGIVDIDPGSAVDSLVTSGKHDVCLVKLDTAGNYFWARSMGGPLGDDYPSVMCTDKNGNLYIIGYFYGTTDWDPSAAVDSLIAKGSWDVFITVLDQNGNHQWCKSFGGYLFDTGTGIGVDLTGNVYTTGGFQMTCDFDPSSSAASQLSAGKNDIFIHKLALNESGVASINNETANFDFYPNPATDQITLTVDSKLIGSDLRIMNVTGNVIMSSTVNRVTSTIALDQFAPGLYFMQVGQGRQGFKLIVY